MMLEGATVPVDFSFLLFYGGLFEMVKEVSGRTPNEWIDTYVVKEIRLMLKNSNLSVKEIANEMHFNNQSFMAKYFKFHVGMTPTEYRKR